MLEMIAISEEIEVKRQLWTPKPNRHSCLHPLWVLEIYNEVGEFSTYRCVDIHNGNTFYMAPAVLTGFFEPTEEYELVE